MTSIIATEVSGVCSQVYRQRLRGVILTGSLARGEGTVSTTDQTVLLGDAEFIAVFHQELPLPDHPDLRVLENQITGRLARRGLRARITLNAVHPGYLRGLAPSIFAYELRSCGQVVAGDPHLLSIIPSMASADVPAEDGWRMLANRLIEQLEGADELLDNRPVLSVDTHYRTVKLILDMATSLLVFLGRYAPTYQERARTLETLIGSPAGRGRYPFALEPFVRDVVACTRWKLAGPTPGPALDSRELWKRAMRYASELWEWELRQLTEAREALPAKQLMDLWMRRQPVSARLRGWASVGRKRGWYRSLHEWPRWTLRAATMSPRYATYAAGVALALGIASAADRDLPPAELERLARLCGRLPLAEARPGNITARDLAETALRNYKEFLVETTA